ncbi:hypothetical protein RclHR1_27030001 [Rhizophagus clarus]|uniref:Uncharacterized protein n=1 Tax=Rhizophagus clarus TaxID=94130 RepID=A0A2Z6RFB3_9GLOM|nr:hypothetical protein RclHR1_27030001 [Rhizophagus clarus]
MEKRFWFWTSFGQDLDKCPKRPIVQLSNTGYMMLFDKLHGRDRRPLSHFHRDRDVLISCSRNNWCPIMDYIMNAHGSSFIDISPFRRRSSRTPKGRRVLRR